jgi:hypothetical protein
MQSVIVRVSSSATKNVMSDVFVTPAAGRLDTVNKDRMVSMSSTRAERIYSPWQSSTTGSPRPVLPRMSCLVGRVTRDASTPVADGSHSLVTDTTEKG